MFHERVIVPIIMDIEHIAREANAIVSDWDGESEKFVHDGDVYTDEDAGLYSDIEKTAIELSELLSSTVTMEQIISVVGKK